jgi:precorrin-6B methylase 2
MIARRSAIVYAVEKSAAMAERARETTAALANARVIVADAEDLGLVRAHVPHADLVFVDIGGSTPAAKVLDVARWYEELYRPRALVVRSTYLNHFVAGLASVEPTRDPSSLTP